MEDQHIKTYLKVTLYKKNKPIDEVILESVGKDIIRPAIIKDKNNKEWLINEIYEYDFTVLMDNRPIRAFYKRRENKRSWHKVQQESQRRTIQWMMDH